MSKYEEEILWEKENVVPGKREDRGKIAGSRMVRLPKDLSREVNQKGEARKTEENLHNTSTLF